MATIQVGENKNFWCKIGFHKWGEEIRHAITSSNVVDIDRKCKRCGQIERETIPTDFEFGYEAS